MQRRQAHWLPGSRPRLVAMRFRTDLDDPTSPLARTLLTGARAMRGKFHWCPRMPGTTFLSENRARAADVEGTIVRFSDPRQEFTTPATPEELPGAGTNRAREMSAVRAARPPVAGRAQRPPVTSGLLPQSRPVAAGSGPFSIEGRRVECIGRPGHGCRLASTTALRSF